ncbi:unnamed protein product [Prorocentrum cordatum]|uniref:Uncharacterized protein n=1 Tax=Prorocentrum cordatum TaxID=2364126 RepID=A0ABN9W679_9DINO|nr:unnamed protein product [Polarella glacialis]
MQGKPLGGAAAPGGTVGAAAAGAGAGAASAGGAAAGGPPPGAQGAAGGGADTSRDVKTVEIDGGVLFDLRSQLESDGKLKDPEVQATIQSLFSKATQRLEEENAEFPDEPPVGPAPAPPPAWEELLDRLEAFVAGSGFTAEQAKDTHAEFCALAEQELANTYQIDPAQADGDKGRGAPFRFVWRPALTKVGGPYPLGSPVSRAMRRYNVRMEELLFLLRKGRSGQDKQRWVNWRHKHFSLEGYHAEALHEAIQDHKWPGIGVSLMVGDTGLLAVGGQLVRCTLFVCRSLEKLEMKVSRRKSILVASGPKLGKQLAWALREFGFKHVQATKNLGVDFKLKGRNVEKLDPMFAANSLPLQMWVRAVFDSWATDAQMKHAFDYAVKASGTGAAAMALTQPDILFTRALVDSKRTEFPKILQGAEYRWAVKPASGVLGPPLRGTPRVIGAIGREVKATTLPLDLTKFYNYLHHVTTEPTHREALGAQDCEGEPSEWRDWTYPKKQWCCENFNTACPDSEEFDCVAGVDNWKTGWSSAKVDWCCQNYDAQFCSTDGYSCDEGVATWREGWSDKKIQWCCEHSGDAQFCEGDDAADAGAAGDAGEWYDCQEGVDNWLEGWEQPKKLWCCANFNHAFCDEMGRNTLDDFPAPGADAKLECQAGRDRWDAHWPEGRMEWCCQHGGAEFCDPPAPARAAAAAVARGSGEPFECGDVLAVRAESEFAGWPKEPPWGG